MGAISLNLVGKLTLINVVLAVFPIFTCSFSLAPNSIIQEIGKEIRRFLRQGGKHNGTKKLHLIKWEMVCRKKYSGGAGVKELDTMNLVLSEKIIWKMIS